MQRGDNNALLQPQAIRAFRAVMSFSITELCQIILRFDARRARASIISLN